MDNSLSRGVVYLIFAQIIFLVSGYLVHAFLGRWLGPAHYGIFGVVIYVSTIILDFARNGVPQAASKFIAEQPANAGAIKNTCSALQFFSSLFLFIGYFLLAPYIAFLLGDDSLTKYLRFSAFLIPLGAFHSLYLNFLNGMGWYKEQVLAAIVDSIVRLLSIIVFLLLGWSIFGALLGYVIGSLFGFLTARMLFRIESNSSFQISRIITFSLPLLVFSISFTFLFSVDLFFVKYLIENHVMVGYYTAASTLSRLPFFVFSAIGVAIFPAISKSTVTNNTKQTNQQIRQSIRYTLLLLIPTTVLIGSTSTTLSTVFFSDIYAPAGRPLSVLIVGAAFYTLFSILCQVITSSGHPRVSMLLSIVSLPIAASLLYLLIPMYDLWGAALAATITFFIAFLFSVGYVHRQFGRFIDFVSLLRIGVSAGILYVLALSLPLTKYLVLLAYPALFALYLVLLWILREITCEDIRAVKTILPQQLASHPLLKEF